jgi:CheY-like chemotaxis protein
VKEHETEQRQRAHKILIADDEPWFVQPLKDALEFEGYEVENVRTGSETLAKIRSENERPDVLILDIMMDPGEMQGPHQGGTRTGIVVLGKIRQELGLSATTFPVICLTVVDDNSVRKNVRQLDAECLFKKDFRLSDVVRLVREKIATVA